MLITSISHRKNWAKIRHKAFCAELENRGVPESTYVPYKGGHVYILCVCMYKLARYGVRNGLCSIRIDRFLANGRVPVPALNKQTDTHPYDMHR
jgi:hypothetical protein